MDYYRDNFNALPCFQIDVTPALVERFVSCCVYFETKNENASALNTPLLGVTPIYFTAADTMMLFSILNINNDEIASIIADSPYTDPNWVVSNDPYNNVIVYLVYRIMSSKRLDSDTRHRGAMALLKLLHYKYFTSLVGNSYPYGADEATMSWVINNLNNKFGLAKLESWRRVIEDRCEYLLSPECKQHFKTFREYRDDVGIIYVMSDTQSNLRQKIVRINRLYYDAKERNEAIGQYKTLDTLDGAKIITSSVEIFDSMNAGMQLQIQAPTRLLDMELVDVVTSRYPEVSKELFKLLLEHFCTTAAEQAKNSSFKSVVQVNNEKTGGKDSVYVSCSRLTQEFLQKTYRYCMMDKNVDMGSKKAILAKTINIYTSSQLVDDDILMIKRSFIYYVTKTELTRRPATISALSLCMIIYFLIRSFDYIK